MIKRHLTSFFYESVNHLGNFNGCWFCEAKPYSHESRKRSDSGVLVTYSDKRLSECFEDTLYRYVADVKSQTDYSAFHALLPDRQWYSNKDSSNYRFGGSNGQEKIDEISGVGNHYTAEYWEMDPRLGRRWNVDPLESQFPGQSPFSIMNDNPNYFIDPDGRAAVPPDDHYINNDGSIRSVKTEDNFDRFYVQDNLKESGYREVGKLDRNEFGLVKFPESGLGFNNYVGGITDKGGYDSRYGEKVGAGDRFILPQTAAALFGLTNELGKMGLTVSLGDMSSSNGSDPWQPSSDPLKPNKHHAGHGHLGSRSGLDVDFRYLNNEGVSFQNRHATTSTMFSISNNQTVYDLGKKYGFTENYQGLKGTLNNVKKVIGHDDHGHLGLNHNNLDWKYVPKAPSNNILLFGK